MVIVQLKEMIKFFFSSHHYGITTRSGDTAQISELYYSDSSSLTYIVEQETLRNFELPTLYMSSALCWKSCACVPL